VAQSHPPFGKVHVRGDEVFLQSSLNPPPPDLPDEDEVESILAGMEKLQKLNIIDF